jgi:catechol 2,3-dioxygenase-like lactoylglutathione lyase family enzyme
VTIRRAPGGYDRHPIHGPMPRLSRVITSLAAVALATLPIGAQPAPAGSPALRTTGAFFALTVADIDATRTWYAEKLGLSVIMDVSADGGGRAVVLSGGGLTVELVRQPGAVALRSAAPSVQEPLGIHGIFKVGMVIDEYDRALETLRSRGVTFAMGPFPARDGFPANAIFRDNEGNYVQVIAR